MQNFRKFSLYLIAPVLTLLIFIFLFEIWKLDLHLPVFSYEHDALTTFFVTKNIIEQGWFFSNDFVGWPHLTQTFYIHDFPVNSDFFNFLVLKAFTYFSSDPFLIVNSFFIFTFFLIPLFSFVVLRELGITAFTAIIISILYSFTPYHFYRGTWHLFLSDYAIVPLILMVALWISSNKITLIAVNQKNQFCLKPNCFFFIAFAICIFAATNGIYYALYACIIFTFAWILYGLKNGKFCDRQFFTLAIFSLTIIFVLLCLSVPSFLYWAQNGASGKVVGRGMVDSELLALKIVNLFLPVENHYISYFSNLRKVYDLNINMYEGSYCSLGILGAIGFLFLLLWLVAKTQNGENSFFQRTIKRWSLAKNEQNLISDLAGLNLFIVLFATVGGLVMLLAMAFPMLRSHARFSIFIAFLAAILIAIIFDKIIQRRSPRQKIFAQIAIVIIAILSLYDQVGRVSAKTTHRLNDIERSEITSQFYSDRNFVEEIERTLPQGAMIMQMPLRDFPEGGSYDLMVGYLYSKNLRWSYPAMRGREASVWQHEVLKLDFKKFIAELKKAGFSAIYLDRQLMSKDGADEKNDNWQAVRKFEAQL
jgi:phosphoglycerol transferase